MDVAADLPRVAAENLRVTRAAFGQAWQRAEQVADETDPDDGYTTGIILAFRWLAGRTVYTPVTREVATAMPETIETELLAAYAAADQPGRHPRRVDIARGAAAVLSWVWSSGPLPLVLH